MTILRFFEESHRRQFTLDKLASADIIITSLSYLSSDYTVLALHTASHLLGIPFNFHAYHFHRIIVDECHDAVALGSATTKLLARLACSHFWCVTGTPFPQGDDSAYGINKLLHININFVLSKSIFLPPNTYLPPTHEFEILKSALYVMNPPPTPEDKGLTADAAAGGKMDALSYEIQVLELNFSPIEWAFYKEESRQIFSRNLFSDRFNGLRQLCCHPACCSKWMLRLTGSHGITKSHVTMSLDQLRRKMVRWKQEDIVSLQREIFEDQANIVYALNTMGLVFQINPITVREYTQVRQTLDVSKEENSNDFGEVLSYDESEKCRLRGPEGRYFNETKSAKAYRTVRDMEREEMLSLLKSCHDYVLNTR